MRQDQKHKAGAEGKEGIISPLVAVVFSLLLVASLCGTATADTPVTLYRSFAGNVNITGTGGTLRTQPDAPAGNPCLVANNGSMQLSGLPAGSTVVAAYLYWAGSGGDPAGGAAADYNVTFNGTNLTADRTFTAWYDATALGYNFLYFFGGVKDVTTSITGNGVYTFSNLAVQNANVAGGGQYCTAAAVVSAFSLVVIYNDPAEILHVVNLWEGFQSYRGGSITLTPSNFTVPAPAPVTPLSSRVLILTWEGDSGNSGALGGFTENLTFCSPTPCVGTALTDGINPANNQFNSSVDIPASGPFLGPNAVYGNDIDLYDITAMVPAAASSAQSVYSSGGDLVILMNQTMSIPNVPVADLAITKSHAGNFAVGSNGVYTLSVSNNGPSDTSGTITVTDTLPVGFTYVGATGTDWTCGAAGQDVTCTRALILANGASAPDIALTVAVGAAAVPGVTNSASVSSGAFDNVAGNNTANDPTIVIPPNLSASTKTWTDQNGGDQDPGDVIRYTITVIESGGALASNVTVTDSLAAALTNPQIVSCTGFASCVFGGSMLTASTGTVPAGGSVTIVFDATISAPSPPPITLIDNCATITNPAGPGAAPCAGTITVSASQVPVNGNKPLYLYGAPGLQLSRTPTTGVPAAITIPRGGNSQTWTLAPALELPVRISATVNPTVPVQLWLATNNNRNYPVAVRLACSSAPGTYLSQTQSVGLTGTPTLFTFNLSAQPSPTFTTMDCAAPDSWQLTIFNNFGAGVPLRNVLVYPVDPATSAISQAVLPSLNVINVDSVNFYSAAYPDPTSPAVFTSGDTVYIRAEVSDPFGDADITSATVTITPPSGPSVGPLAMTEVVPPPADPARRTFERVYAAPAPPSPTGFWTATITANEGTEGTVSDIGISTFRVEMPGILTLKSAQTFSDPYNQTTNPKAIPAALVEYTVRVTNTGMGTAQGVAVIDYAPANTELILDDILAGRGPVIFTDGAGALVSGLTYTFVSLNDPADDLFFSNSGAGGPWDYTPNPTGGVDSQVTHIRIAPGGRFNGASGGNNPYFELKFRVRVK